ncbi:hypothetical protein D3C87_1726120 [compost metagenome]
MPLAWKYKRQEVVVRNDAMGVVVRCHRLFLGKLPGHERRDLVWVYRQRDVTLNATMLLCYRRQISAAFAR